MAESATCRDDERMSLLMSMALDGLLDPSEQQRLHDHLSRCQACQAEWAAMQQVSEVFRQVPMVSPPLGFASRIERRLAEKRKQRRRALGSVAVVTGSLSLAALTITAVVVIVLGVLVWNWLDSVPSVAQGTSLVSQLASGMGLVGRGASLFLADLLLQYGLPLMAVAGISVLLLAGIWIWLFVKRPGGYHTNGYA